MNNTFGPTQETNNTKNYVLYLVVFNTISLFYDDYYTTMIVIRLELFYIHLFSLFGVLFSILTSFILIFVTSFCVVLTTWMIYCVFLSLLYIDVDMLYLVPDSLFTNKIIENLDVSPARISTQVSYIFMTETTIFDISTIKISTCSTYPGISYYFM